MPMVEDSTRAQTSRIVTGALFDFVGHLCSSSGLWTEGKQIKQELLSWAKLRGLDLTEADVMDWDKHV